MVQQWTKIIIGVDIVYLTLMLPLFLVLSSAEHLELDTKVSWSIFSHPILLPTCRCLLGIEKTQRLPNFRENGMTYVENHTCWILQSFYRFHKPWSLFYECCTTWWIISQFHFSPWALVYVHKIPEFFLALPRLNLPENKWTYRKKIIQWLLT